MAFRRREGKGGERAVSYLSFILNPAWLCSNPIRA